jgi:hypothetical protein
MDWKWSHIWNHVNSAIAGSPDDLYINFTSASGGIFPKDVAKGLVVFWCFAYEDGMNERTFFFLRSKPEVCRVGVIMMDYPGAALIDAIIAKNGLPTYCFNSAPVAAAGGPYEVGEGTETVFDGSGTTDADGDTLTYRWDIWELNVLPDSTLDTNVIQSTDWSLSPTTAHTWYDEAHGIANLQVNDGLDIHTVEDAAPWVVNNVAPTVAIDSLLSPVPGCLLPGQEVSLRGHFMDPGYRDTHTALWIWGDGQNAAGTMSEENELPAATGHSWGKHVYADPGTYGVELQVADDDGGVGSAVRDIRVMTVSEGVDFLDSVLWALPDASFRYYALSKKAALSEACAGVKDAIAADDLSSAMWQLRRMRSRVDGTRGSRSQRSPMNRILGADWVTDRDAQRQLCRMIDELLASLRFLHINSATLVPDAVASHADVPIRFTLSQNYPNPFNPSTEIRFSLPSAGHVRLEIFNIRGRRVATLVDAPRGAGVHTVSWDGSDLASGIYIYRIQAGSDIMTRRMLLLK